MDFSKLIRNVSLKICVDRKSEDADSMGRNLSYVLGIWCVASWEILSIDIPIEKLLVLRCPLHQTKEAKFVLSFSLTTYLFVI